MIRIVLENIFFFLLPTLFYLAWVAFREQEWPGLSTVVRQAPLVRLFIAGAVLMLATLVGFSTRSYNAPDDVYVPQSMQDGKLEPGRTIRAPEPHLDKK